MRTLVVFAIQKLCKSNQHINVNGTPNLLNNFCVEYTLSIVVQNIVTLYFIFIIQPSSMCLFSLWKGQCQKIFAPPSQFVSRKTNPSCRVGNSLFGFLCESLIFWQKRELIALSLILKEQIALFALFVKSDKSD